MIQNETAVGVVQIFQQGFVPVAEMFRGNFRNEANFPVSEGEWDGLGWVHGSILTRFRVLGR
ncbi:MAG TPA: hypothetical protein VHO69_08960 [Phototrophicaceae bacterium]|nr:hypothetical protein [Phototrophicaceae bacterium]